MAHDWPTLQVAHEAAARLRAAAPGHVDVVGPWGAAKSLVASQTAQHLRARLLLITSGRLESEAAFEDLATFADPDHCLLFPSWEVLPSDLMSPADDIVAERMNTLEKLALWLEKDEPAYVVVPVRSLLQYVASRKRLEAETITLRTGEEYELEDLTARLSRMGYQRELMVEQRGEISVRGGILDVFPISGELPYRIEFFGDEIESIRRFEPETQRSIGQVDTLHVLPRSEKALLANRDDVSVLTDYFPGNTLVAVDEPMAVYETAKELEAQFTDSRYMMTWDDIARRLESFPRIDLAQVALAAQKDRPRLTQPMHSVATWAGDIDGFWGQLKQWDANGFTVSLVCHNTGERQRLLELLEEQGYRPGTGSFDLRIALGRLRAGFSSDRDKLAVLSEREIFGRRYVRRTRRRFEAGQTITAFSDLRVGDYIVHQQHGIGRYLGLKRFEGKSGDFLTVQYSGGDKLYLPVTHIDLVQKYVGGDGSVPRVDRIGGATWARTKARVKKAVKDMTQELLELYARRGSVEGHPFSPDTHWQREFEDAFEYEETADQARAIVDVKRDMEMPRPMDRLLCGDVGYGKTEVALRAAFKAVMDGKQVALLVPTTVLAQQHYSTFSERLADYPVRVEMLSRFSTPKQQRETVERMKSGEVDIVVGTHRITSKDIRFKDLGLVIIDEEQRFGVAHKEKLKHLRANVDVLTMTATPIPRTLHLSLLGIRDMSLINTAPNDRLPIHTCIDAFDERLIQEAIVRELGREGQVFYLHNRVQTIEQVAVRINKLVPAARVAVAHGQMGEHRLEEVMSAFIRKEVDVLVCTTIIGSGLDIPNANTIVVDRADTFGLADLYQIRGRVGRYKHRAFAYLLIPGDRALSEDAQKRLKALEEFSSLGAGFRIAMRDLEIRGCGNILGGEQSGNIAAVGYEAYTQLIEECVAELKGEPLTRRPLPPFDLVIDAYIPEAYVPSEAQKITLYKRIAGVQSSDEVREIRDELTDRFGAPPAPVRRLLEVMGLRALGAEIGAIRMAAARDGVSVEFDSGRLISRKTRNVLEQTFGNRIQFTWQDKPGLTLQTDPQQDGDPLAATRNLLQALAEL